jgi:tetratricopeptide (TPR) repeat protein
MVRFRVTAHQSGYCGNRIATSALVVIALFASSLTDGQSVQGQSQSADSATLQGSVRDSRGHPLATATIYLLKGEAQTLITRSDSEGTYRFPALGEGTYTLRVEMVGYHWATVGPCVLGRKETKRVDLTLEAVFTSQSAAPETSGAETPQFFDEPAFTVAGVTEAMNPGGHGSDTILRTTEALVKETTSLGVPALNKESSGSRAASASSSSSTEQSLRKMAEREPGNFAANHQLGKLLVDDGKAREALPYLQRASQLKPGDYENAYELALAHAAAGQYERARMEARTLLDRRDNAEQEQAKLHHLLGDIEEKVGNPLEAVWEYQRAAELDPNEPSLFDWGAELLLHRAFEPAIEVFSRGNRLFPHSARVLAGLGVAWYARGAYDQAAQRLCEASDLNPDDPNPYLFMGKMQSVETAQSQCVAERLRRFAGLQPENALANYYYALSLWNRREGSQSAEKLAEVESLLEKIVHLDPKFGAAYLQFGILYSEQGDSFKAIAAYQRAIEADPELEQAHYRLAQAYSRTGEKAKAQAQLQLYAQLTKKTAEQGERERREIQQFVYTLRDPSSVSRPR